jgi:hypothetical protein
MPTRDPGRSRMVAFNGARYSSAASFLPAARVFSGSQSLYSIVYLLAEDEERQAIKCTWTARLFGASHLKTLVGVVQLFRGHIMHDIS